MRNESMNEALTALMNTKQVKPKLEPEPSLPAPTCTHDDIIEYMLEHPGCTTDSIAMAFGQHKRWFLTLLATDSFQLKLDPVRHLVSDPTITSTMEERFRSLTLHSLNVLQKKLDATDVTDQTILKAAEIGVKALGLGVAKEKDKGNEPPPATVDSLAERLVAALEKQRRNVRAPVTLEQGVDHG